jgi:hypothetical protein
MKNKHSPANTNKLTYQGLAVSAGLMVLALVGNFSTVARVHPSAEKKVAAVGTESPFIQNVGQTDPRVKFVSQLKNGAFYVGTNGELTYSFSIPQNKSGGLTPEHREDAMTSGRYVIKENFVTDRAIAPKGTGELDVSVNYFKSATESYSNVPNFSGIDLGEVFKGTGIALKAQDSNVEKIFTVNPQGDPAAIVAEIRGSDKLGINQSGELELHTSEGTITFTKPVAFQEINGTRKNVEVAYRLLGQNRYGFTVGAYDKNYALVIDPLLSATYLGGNDWEGEREVFGGNANMILANGSLYITAYTDSNNFPTTAGAFQETKPAVVTQVFVSKFDLALGTLEASTFLGGTVGGNSSEPVIASDASGNIFVAGNTRQTDFPGTAGNFQPAIGGGMDTFVAKLNSNLTSLLAATYLGGTGSDWANGLAINQANGEVYVSSDATAGYPAPGSGYDQTHGAGTYNIAIIRLNNALNAGLSMTYIGVANYYGALAIDSTGDVFVQGGSAGTIASFPIVRANAGIPSFQETGGGSNDTFVARFSGDLTALEASTLFGGAGWENDFAHTIVVCEPPQCPTDQVFITGDSNQAGNYLKTALNANANTIDNNPGADKVMTFGSLSVGAGTGDDVYVARFNRDLQTAAATIIGGTDTDNIPFIDVNSSGEVYLAADTYSNNFPVTEGRFSASPGDGDVDIIGAKFSNDLGTLLGSSYVTSTGYDNYPGSIVVDESNGYDVAYINAETTSTVVPGTSLGYQTAPGDAGIGDLFITRFTCAFASICPPENLNATTGTNDGEVDLTWTAPNLAENNSQVVADYEIHYSDDNFVADDNIFAHAASTATNITVTGLVNATTYYFKVKAVVGAAPGAPSNVASAAAAGAGPSPSAIEIHVGSVNVSSNVTVGISDGTATPRAAGHYANSFGSPSLDGFASLVPGLPRAVRYDFDGGGLIIEDDTITYSPDTLTGAATVLSQVGGPDYDDDYVGPPITLPFPVYIFGVSTDTIAISSNGFIYVESGTTGGLPGGTGCCAGEDMSAQTLSGDDFMIAGDWTDLYPAGQGTIKTETFGTAPNRRFIVEFNNISQCCDALGGNTFQIKFFETAAAPPPGGVSSSGQGEETIQPGILQLTSVPANFSFPPVDIIEFQTYSTVYSNAFGATEKLTAEDRRFSGGFEVQITATDYVGQTNPSNTISVDNLGIMTQNPSAGTTYLQTSTVENIHNPASGTLISGSNGTGVMVTQTLPFYLSVYGRESNKIYICSTGFMVSGADLVGMLASDFNAFCGNPDGGPPAGNYSILIPYINGGDNILSTTNTGAFDADNGIYYEQISDNEVRIRYKANVSSGGLPVGTVAVTADLFKDGRIEYHYGTVNDADFPAVGIYDNQTATQISPTVEPFISYTTGSQYSGNSIRFSPVSTDFNDVSRPGTPPVYALTNGTSTANPANFTMFTSDTGNPGFSVPLTAIEGSACLYHGRLGNYTFYPSFMLQIPPETTADTYQNTITFTIMDKTLPNGSQFCPPV